MAPTFAPAYVGRGDVWRKKGNYDKALGDYNHAVALESKNSVAFNNRAWLLATCPDAKYRDGKVAVESATRACELSKWKDARRLDTLAAACAEAGNFPKAVEWQEKANTLFTDAESKTRGGERLKLYQHKRPYRESAVGANLSRNP